MPEPIIQEALDLAEELQDGDNDYGEERRILLGLCNLVNKWKEIAIDGHTKKIYWDRFPTAREWNNQKASCRLQAIHELNIEETSYRRITPEIISAFTLAIGTMKSEADLLDQMERMNLGETRTNVGQLLDAIEILKKLKE